MLRKLALGYAAIICAAAIWAWVIEIALFGSPQEHLLPGIVLTLWSAPTSLLTTGLFCTESNGYCGQYGQLAVITACGTAQAVALLLGARWLRSARAEKALHRVTQVRR